MLVVYQDGAEGHCVKNELLTAVSVGTGSCPVCGASLTANGYGPTDEVVFGCCGCGVQFISNCPRSTWLAFSGAFWRGPLASGAPEPRVTINGVVLTTAQSMALRVAACNVQMEMKSKGALGNDGVGESIRHGYSGRIGEVVALMLKQRSPDGETPQAKAERDPNL